MMGDEHLVLAAWRGAERAQKEIERAVERAVEAERKRMLADHCEHVRNLVHHKVAAMFDHEELRIWNAGRRALGMPELRWECGRLVEAP